MGCEGVVGASVKCSVKVRIKGCCGVSVGVDRDLGQFLAQSSICERHAL